MISQWFKYGLCAGFVDLLDRACLPVQANQAIFLVECVERTVILLGILPEIEGFFKALVTLEIKVVVKCLQCRNQL